MGDCRPDPEIFRGLGRDLGGAARWEFLPAAEVVGGN